ncbi:peptidoglycan DD-metalloendopeptidase family protein [Nocardia terpenica]|uniref:Peptidoglycan DD-metalloendopeptidase family protein n=1 Tax=Nocardia terpenica TaxID=455432 RepID=A0A6G9ZI69_9NOCA|nr:peptidoglycan DD-metalloendopeptidase family protein [Nocardia terpenica]
MVVTTVVVLLFDSAGSTPGCAPSVIGQTTIPAPLLAGHVAPPPAADPGAAAGTAPVAGRRAMPLAAGSFQVSSPFGPREGGEMHRGVDLAAAAGSPIFAATDGTVVAAGPASGFGHWIVIDSVDERGRPLSTVYGHMFADGVGVSVGQKVSAGQQIGAVGSDGESSGPHLHFEVVPGGRLTGGQQIDPVPWLGGAATDTTAAGTGGASATAGGAPAPAAAGCPPGFGTAGGELREGSVPADLAGWYRQAGSLCPQISASLLAAQGKQESGFRRGLTSPSGAQGLAQFLPGTAASIDPDDGRPYVIDADGTGRASVWDDGDAIIGQGRYMCALAHKIDAWKAEGKVSGDTAQLALAAYNAGEGAVLQYGGIPPFSQTQQYVAAITAGQGQFRGEGATGRFIPSPHAGAGMQAVSAARQWLGTPYVWGGGGPGGPSGGGFDCSGLTSAVIFEASGGRIRLPRTSEQQWSVGTEIPLARAEAGDLVYGDFDPDTGLPGHVGVVVDATHMIHAPQTGQVVTEAPIPPGMRARRVM